MVVNVDDFDYWVTLGGFKKTDGGSPTAKQISDSRKNAMKLFWLLHGVKGTAVDNWDDSTLTDLDLDMSPPATSNSSGIFFNKRKNDANAFGNSTMIWSSSGGPTTTTTRTYDEFNNFTNTTEPGYEKAKPGEPKKRICLSRWGVTRWLYEAAWDLSIGASGGITRMVSGGEFIGFGYFGAGSNISITADYWASASVVSVAKQLGPGPDEDGQVYLEDIQYITMGSEPDLMHFVGVSRVSAFGSLPSDASVSASNDNISTKYSEQSSCSFTGFTFPYTFT